MDHDSPPIMVCLISHQTMQNLLPILQDNLKQVVLITTKEEDNSRLHLETVMRARHIPAEPPLYVDA